MYPANTRQVHLYFLKKERGFNVYVQQYSERSHTIGAHAQIKLSVMNQQDAVESSLLH